MLRVLCPKGWWPAALGLLCLAAALVPGWRAVADPPPKKIAPNIQRSSRKVSAAGKTFSVTVLDADLATVKLKVGLGGGHIGRTESLGKIAVRYGAVAAANGCYFDAYTKNALKYPDFAIVCSGQLQWRSDLGVMLGYIPGQAPRIGRVFHHVRGTVGEGTAAREWIAYTVNRNRGEFSLRVFTPTYSEETTPDEGRQAVVADGRIQSLGDGRQRIPKNGFVVQVVGGGQLPPGFAVGQPCQAGLALRHDVPDAKFWTSLREGLACGPTLVRDGEVAVDPPAEGFQDPKVLTLAWTRSAVGVKKDGHLLLVAAGALTMKDLGAVMKALGCQAAMSLDGGASSGLWLKGSYLRQPGRDLSNALLLLPLD